MTTERRKRTGRLPSNRLPELNQAVARTASAARLHGKGSPQYRTARAALDATVATTRVRRDLTELAETGGRLTVEQAAELAELLGAVTPDEHDQDDETDDAQLLLTAG